MVVPEKPDAEEKLYHVTDRLLTEKERPVISKNVSVAFKNKDTDELQFLEKPEDKAAAQVSFLQLFRYAKAWEIFLTLLGTVCACIAALGIPYNVVVYGEFTTLLVDRSFAEPGIPSTTTLIIGWFGGGQILINATSEENRLALIEDSRAFGMGCSVGAALQFIFCVLAIDLINYSALKQISRIRLLFLQAVLRQDMTWYDTSTGNNFATRITDDLEKLKEGIADKLAIFVYLVASFVSCVLFAFLYGWKLTLVVLSCAPLIIVATAFVAKMQSSLTAQEMISYGNAGTIAEEVLSSIRTVVAFGGEKKEVDRYRANLAPCERTGQLKGIYSGLGGGLMWLFIYCCYALAFWYGMELILEDRDQINKEYTPAILVIVLFGVLVGAQNLGFTSPHMEAFATAKGSAKAIYDIINRRPLIDSMGTQGLKPKTIVGHIEFRDVFFDYPARSNVKVLQGLNLTVQAGHTVALVGMSGCGKSTCLQLLQRLYDPMKGAVYVDGHKISDYNTACLRSFIGVVGQEPVLFSTSIADNIRYGKPDATMDEIESACRIANCHGFIAKLPNGYDTLVGERGGALSGGQKQRIAIARALVRNPVLLILDEATSALDPNSERLVQDALDRASKGRTTIVVSHRLSTITNADKIVYVECGQVAEQGNHAELLKMKGKYFDLVAANNAKNQEDSKAGETVLSRTNSHKVVSRQATVESVGTEEEEDEEKEPDEEEDKNEEGKYKVSMMRVLGLNNPEWRYNILGSISAIMVGASLPLFAIIFGEFYGLMSLPDEVEVRRESLRFSIYFLLLGLLAGFGTFFQTYMFNVAGVKLTSRLRTLIFETTMKQEMGWFDDARNGVGVICARLSGDCASVQGACGSRLGTIMQSFSTLIIGVVISLFYSVKLTCVAIISIPVVLAACYYESKYTAMSSLKEKQAMERGCRMAVEAIANIKTVASLGQEAHVLNRYTEEINHAESACQGKIRYRGTVYALGQTTPVFGYALAFWYGGLLVANEGLEYKNVIKVSEALIFGAWMLSQALSYAPNVNVAVLSAGRLLRLMDRVPQYNNPDNTVQRETKVQNGNVNFSKLEFSYPTRKDFQIMKEFDLNVPAGKTIALVGPSGCGKSTCIQLLLRYYDPDSGTIELDGTRSTDFTLASLRSQIGLVSQEPVLFDRTIAENIAYGDNRRVIPMTEIIEAARKANIHEFVASLPSGYETRLGIKGAQMSGGQKQRVAIARALVRNPKILLLDEATSALDSQSESIVQAALDLASKGRTCITIAHRLSTVQNADMICVIQNGAIMEKGTHDELMRLGKTYRKLYQMQQVN